MKLKIIDSGKAAADKNMALDEQLLAGIDRHTLPCLHFYDWESPSATYGYFAKPQTLLNLQGIAAHGIQLARRPTGGGIIFHQFDFAFSFLLPATDSHFSLNTLENYRFVNSLIAAALAPFLSEDRQLALQPAAAERGGRELRHFCMAMPTVYDLVLGHKKLVGGAQRRTQQGLLHQASIAMVLPAEAFLKAVLPEASTVAAAMLNSSYPLLGELTSPFAYEAARCQLKERLIETFAAQSQV
jgi:lipoate-protein ligase A